MNYEQQKQLTLVSDIKFILTRLDARDQQPLVDTLLECAELLENALDDLVPAINETISKVEKCIADNKIENVPAEVPDLIASCTAFLPTK